MSETTRQTDRETRVVPIGTRMKKRSTRVFERSLGLSLSLSVSLCLYCTFILSSHTKVMAVAIKRIVYRFGLWWCLLLLLLALAGFAAVALRLCDLAGLSGTGAKNVYLLAYRVNRLHCSVRRGTLKNRQ